MSAIDVKLGEAEFSPKPSRLSKHIFGKSDTYIDYTEKNFDGENCVETESLKTRISTKSPPINSKVKKKRRVPTTSPDKRMNGQPAVANSAGDCRSPTALSSPFTNAACTVVSSAACTPTATSTSSARMEVKTERLSPASGITDNNSSGSGSNTPSSSYPETPPGSNHHNDRVPSPALSPATPLSHSKMMEQPVARNYSDIMRSLAAKYNNSNPNDYFSSPKNGLASTFVDPRFTSFKSASVGSPFAGLVSPLTSGRNSPPAGMNASCQLNLSSANTKDSNDTSADLKHMLTATDSQTSLFPSFSFSSFNPSGVPGAAPVNLPLFSPLVDMNSTQALLNIVRSANSGTTGNSINQLETYIKGAAAAAAAVVASSPSTNSCNATGSQHSATKRLAEMVNNPLDLSSNALLCKKVKRSFSNSGDSFSCENLVPSGQKGAVATLLKDRQPKRADSISPKPCTKSMFPVPMAQQQPLLDRSSTTCLSLCTSSLERGCSSREGAENVSHWSIDDVCNFVSSIDLCAEYTEWISAYEYATQYSCCDFRTCQQNKKNLTFGHQKPHL
ncbi:hypothetical protein V9T40_008627 [Parthenolecanium corni]|uniref:Uncharacterized protein n=1 Tax=Parthenolecanium corni TaxID=536013 RepID=A0AAN9TQT5_9HEMI